jgi:hypothetical protein
MWESLEQTLFDMVGKTDTTNSTTHAATDRHRSQPSIDAAAFDTAGVRDETFQTLTQSNIGKNVKRNW